MNNIVKTILMAMIAFFSVFYMTGSYKFAIASALVPLISTLLGTAQTLGYSFSVLCLIAAIFWFVAPEETKVKVRAEIERVAFN